MFNFLEKYLEKNLFYVSVIITGLTSVLFGLFYAFFKDNIYNEATSNFLDGTGVLSAYVTTSVKSNSHNYFIIGLAISLIFFFVIAFILKVITKENYFKCFNLINFLNIILLIGLIFSLIVIRVSIFPYIILIVFILIFMFMFYCSLRKIFKLDIKNSFMFLGILSVIVIFVLIMFKLFV